MEWAWRGKSRRLVMLYSLMPMMILLLERTRRGPICWVWT